MRYSVLPFLYRIFPLAGLSLLAVAVYWFVQISEPAAPEVQSKKPGHTVDYLIEDFSASLLNKEGGTHYRIQGEKLIHYEDDGSYDALQPRLRGFFPGQPEFTVRANFGTLSGDGEQAELFGNAELLRLPTVGPPAREQLSARSEFFRIFVNQDILETDQPIVLQNGRSTVTANGAVYNNVTRLMTLSGDVHGTLPPALKK